MQSSIKRCMMDATNTVRAMRSTHHPLLMFRKIEVTTILADSQMAAWTGI